MWTAYTRGRGREAPAARVSAWSWRLKAATWLSGSTTCAATTCRGSAASSSSTACPEDASDLSYDEWLTLIHPDDRARVAHEVSEVVEGRKPHDIKFRIIRPDGCVRYMRSAARASLNSMGRVVALLGTTWDMTDVFELGSELERQHELMHVTLQSIGEAVITTDPFGLITWLNPVAERLTGWRSAEANGPPAGRRGAAGQRGERPAAAQPARQLPGPGRAVRASGPGGAGVTHGPATGRGRNRRALRDAEGQVLEPCWCCAM